MGGGVYTRDCRYLLKRGADVMIAEKDGYTPPHGVGFQGRSKIVAMLAQFGVPLDEPHSDGNRPIQRACWGREKRHAKTVEQFLHVFAETSQRRPFCSRKKTRPRKRPFGKQNCHRLAATTAAFFYVMHAQALRR